MASSPDIAKQLLLATGALLPAALLFFVGTGENPQWWAVWCGILIVLAAAPRVPAFDAVAVGAGAWFLGSFNMVRYTENILVIPNDAHVVTSGAVIFSVLVFMVVPALAFGLAVAVFRAFVRRGALWQAALAFPALWVGYEFLSAMISPHGTGGNIAYTQMDVLPLLQVASLTGVWGISFCVFLLPAALAAMIAQSDRRRQKLLLAMSVGGLFVCVLGFGLWRLQAPAAENANTVKVGLIASDLPQNFDVQEPGDGLQRLLRDYEAHAADLTAQGAEIIVLPEKLGVTIPPTLASDDALLQAFADRTKAEILYGVIRRAGPMRLNEARLYSPAQAHPIVYDKHHMLPSFESRYTPGTTRTLLRRPSGLWGIAVCKDMDFPELSRAYAQEGIGLMLVPAWDFDDDNWWHARIAIMRGVESGFTIVRAAKQGLLTVSDDRGRILAVRSSKAAPFASLVFAAPVRHNDTIYARFGDWFAWLCIALMLGCAATLVRRPTGSPV